MRSSAARAYSLLFFLSGATGLVYELLWVRVLYQTFGSTIQSVTTVVAAYMGGLGLGAWLLGRRADRDARPAALYGMLEIAIAVFGLFSPFVLGLAHRLYLGGRESRVGRGRPRPRTAHGPGFRVGPRAGCGDIGARAPAAPLSRLRPPRPYGLRVAARRDRVDAGAGDGGGRLDLCVYVGSARLPARDRAGKRIRGAS